MNKQQWVTSFDGTQIGYRIHGKGDKVIALCNGITCVDSYWKYVTQHLSARYRVLTWDYREHGVSHSLKNEKELMISSHARDLKAILNKEGIDSALIGGFSMGVQVSLEYYRLFPEDCSGLLLVAGPAGKPFDSLIAKNLFKGLFKTFYPVGVRLNGLLQPPLKLFCDSPLVYPWCRLSQLISSAASREDMQLHYDHIAKLNIAITLKMAKAMQTHSAYDLLPHIKIPVLVIGGTKDIFTCYWAVEKMHHMTPNSEILTIPLGTHVLLIEQPEFINLRIDKFIEERLWPSGQAPLEEAA